MKGVMVMWQPRTYLVRVLGSLFSVLLIASMGVVAVPAYAAVATPDPLRVSGGNWLTVRGAGFSGGERIDVWLSTASGGVFELDPVHADGAGAVTVRVLVRRFWEVNWAAITLRGTRSKREAVAT